MNPQISIIIPLYNKDFAIFNTLQSVLLQTYSNFEVIIVNDGSTDNSLLEIKKISDSRISVYNQDNKGVSSARNLGIEKASGNFISFLDADDYWHPNHLDELVKLIKLKKHLFAFTSFLEVERKNNIYKGNYSLKSEELYAEVDFFEASYKKTILSISNSIFRKEIFKEIGNFNCNFDNAEDTEFFIRVGFKYKIGLVNKYTVIYRYFENSLSNSSFSMKRRCNFSQFIEDETENPKAKKMIDINRFSLAISCKLNGDYKNFLYFKSIINLKNLNSKQLVVLYLPRIAIHTLSKTKHMLNSLGFNVRLY